MTRFQLALSGVTPGTYGSGKKVPVLKIDQTGRVVEAAADTIDATLNFGVNADDTSSIGTANESLMFKAGDGIGLSILEDKSILISLAARTPEEQRSFDLLQVLSEMISPVTSTVFVDNIISRNDVVKINKNVNFIDNNNEIYEQIELIVADKNEVPTRNIKTARGSIDRTSPLNPGDEIYTTNYRGKSSDGWELYFSESIMVDEQDPTSGFYALVPIKNNSFIQIDQQNMQGLFVSHSGVGIGNVRPQATLDINGFAKLKPLSSAPASVAEGTIAIADGKTWNPCQLQSTTSYPVYFDGTSWIKMIG